MDMRTVTASSVTAASGSFGRVVEPEVVVQFDYLWVTAGTAAECDGSPGADTAAIIVYVSSNPIPGANSIEVARILPPVLEGRPGGIGSGQFATFYARFPVDSLDLLGGSFVELKLCGQGSRVLIDNWDPYIDCTSGQCADLSGEGGVSVRDYLLVLSEFGQSLSTLGYGKGCLDETNYDNYVNLFDVQTWDYLLNLANPLEACSMFDPTQPGPAGRSADPASAGGSRQPHLPSLLPTAVDKLLIVGKSAVAGAQDDHIYALDKVAVLAHEDGCLGDAPKAPAGGCETRSNGRLVEDGAGTIYQLHGSRGLIRLADGKVIVGPNSSNPTLILLIRTAWTEPMGPAKDMSRAMNLTFQAGADPVTNPPRVGFCWRLLLKVADTGIGISPAAIDRIFDEFYRTPEAKKCFALGTGMGLPIVRRIVEAHGGSIDVEASPGCGSTFTVTLQMA